MIGGGSGWLQWVAVVGGKVKKLQNFFVCSKGAKKPKKQHVFCFFHIWGVGGSEANVDKSTIFLTLPLGKS